MKNFDEKLDEYQLKDLLSDGIFNLLQNPPPGENINNFVLSIVVKIMKEMETAFKGDPESNRQPIFTAGGNLDCTAIINGLILGMKHDLLEGNLQMIKAFGSAIAERDSGTSIHNFRVTIYATRLAENLGFNKADLQSVVKGALLHDIGKIGIRDGALLKKSALTDAEYDHVKHHVQLGVNIIEGVHWLEDAVDIVLYHHERFNGSGYIHGLKGTDIPIAARVFAIADVFDSLTSERPYKPKYSYEDAFKIMNDEREAMFDPEIFDCFEKISEPLWKRISAYDLPALEDRLNMIINDIFEFTPPSH